MRPDLPTGIVTFLFSDIEGSTKLLDELGPAAYDDALVDHRRVIREAFARCGGVEVDTQGDAFFVAFPDANEALAAAAEAQRALAGGRIHVRMGIHTGSPHLGREGYVGKDVHRAARIAASGHGGQVVLSATTREGLNRSFELLDLGEHRLKDFATPVALSQLGNERFPPLRTISNTNLPRPASAFLGREHEVAEISAALRDGTRLLTLTGPGGMGKTRLAIESAAEIIGDFKAGVFWVGLAALRDPALVPETISQTIGAKDSLADSIGEREMLLLLDNLEQVIEAAPELATLVEACPKLRLLVTSRERLRVRGEVEYAVPPLSDVEAVELFCERAKLDPDETITELCRRLDDLPLAVELAAARTSVLSPTQILERLAKRLDLLKGGRDAEARQATLRATIEWSHDLLTEEERGLFARLSIFRGGFPIDAAEAVCHADLDVLGSLVDKSLIRKTDERLAMLETIREFAAERLEANGEADEVRRRHADYFVALAEEAEPEVNRGSPKAWLDRLGAEHDNIRAALDRLESAGETQSVLHLAGAMVGFWQMRGPYQEAQRRLDRALASDGQPTWARARALHGAVILANDVTQLPVVRARAKEALLISEELEDAHGVAFALQGLGWAAALARDWTKARDRWEASRQAFREVGDDHFYIAVTRSVAWASEELGDQARYRALVEEYVGRAREVGNRRVLARGLGALSMFAIEEGRLDEALGLLNESYRIDTDHGFVVHIATDLVRFAMLAVRYGKLPIAARLVGLSDRLLEDVGNLRESWAAEERDETVAMIEAQLSGPGFTREWQQGRKMEPDQAVTLVLEAGADGTEPSPDQPRSASADDVAPNTRTGAAGLSADEP